MQPNNLSWTDCFARVSFNYWSSATLTFFFSCEEHSGISIKQAHGGMQKTSMCSNADEILQTDDVLLRKQPHVYCLPGPDLTLHLSISICMDSVSVATTRVQMLQATVLFNMIC